MPRKRHPKKAVEEALRYAESSGWRVEVGGGRVEFTAQIMTRTVGVENSALQAFGVRRLTHPIMAGKFAGLSITALPPKMINTRPTT